MKICHWCWYDFPARDSAGSERIVEYLIKGQRELGHDVCLVAKPESKIPVSQEPHSDCDIIHYHGFDPSGDPCDKYDIPIVRTIHGGGSESDPWWLKVAKESGQTIAVSRFVADRIGIRSYVHTCVDPEKFIYKKDKQNYFLWLGGTDWFEAKGVMTTIRLAKKLKFNLIIAGTGQNKNMINEIKRHCDNKIKYVGSVNGKEKAEYIANAKALFHLSKLGDACPATISESLISGTPVIAYRDGSLPELIRHIETGFICDNEKEVIKSIAQIKTINNEKCHEDAMNRFHYLKISEQYINLYRQMIENGRLK